MGRPLEIALLHTVVVCNSKTLSARFYLGRVYCFQCVTIRRAITKSHKATLVGELCHDVSQKFSTAAGEVDVSNTRRGSGVTGGGRGEGTRVG